MKLYAKSTRFKADHINDRLNVLARHYDQSMVMHVGDMSNMGQEPSKMTPNRMPSSTSDQSSRSPEISSYSNADESQPDCSMTCRRQPDVDADDAMKKKRPTQRIIKRLSQIGKWPSSARLNSEMTATQNPSIRSTHDTDDNEVYSSVDSHEKNARDNGIKLKFDDLAEIVKRFPFRIKWSQIENAPLVNDLGESDASSANHRITEYNKSIATVDSLVGVDHRPSPIRRAASFRYFVSRFHRQNEKPTKTQFRDAKDGRKAKSKEDMSKMSVWDFMYQHTTNTICMHAPEIWLKDRLKDFHPLSGHPGTIVPATNDTLFKRVGKDSAEATAYELLSKDTLRNFIPKFRGTYEHNDDVFIEMEDLTRRFENPTSMDVKIGCRTFLESEVTNPTLRPDLLEKLDQLDRNEATAEERAQGAITKLRYMQCREKHSSSHALGFRVEAIKLQSDSAPRKNYKKVKTADQVLATLNDFLIDCTTNEQRRSRILGFIKDLKAIEKGVKTSSFFMTHEMVGSSLLFFYDSKGRTGVYMIDFAKSLQHKDRLPDHESAWQMGNHEDGYLTGIRNLILMFDKLLAIKQDKKVAYFQEDGDRKVARNMSFKEKMKRLTQSATVPDMTHT